MPAASFKARVLRCETVRPEIRLLTVAWDAATPAPQPGQFYMLRAWAAHEPPLLSRPISVHAFDEKKRELTFLYEVRGEGTRKLAALQSGDALQLTGPSGNGFPLHMLAGTVAVVGGGIGIAPLYALVKALAAKGCTVDFYAGYRDEPYGLEAFSAVCNRVQVATDSGKCGTKGFVTQIFDPKGYSAVCVCGPEVMMEAVAQKCMTQEVPVYVSKEAKMACGVGACLGCTCHTKGGAVSVCKDGPVFEGRLVYEQH